MNILAFNGSPRTKGNTALLLEEFLKGAREYGAYCEAIHTSDIELKNCRGCLRCNVIKRCSIGKDDWKMLSNKILGADVLVFASPIYFHHVTAPLKNIIDRFRSFVHVQITESGLRHTPWHRWNKKFILLLCMGSPSSSEAQPVINLFTSMVHMLGSENSLHYVTATRLAVTRQVVMSKDELQKLYVKMRIPAHLVEKDHKSNREILQSCCALGREMGRSVL